MILFQIRCFVGIFLFAYVFLPVYSISFLEFVNIVLIYLLNVQRIIQTLAIEMQMRILLSLHLLVIRISCFLLKLIFGRMILIQDTGLDFLSPPPLSDYVIQMTSFLRLERFAARLDRVCILRRQSKGTSFLLFQRRCFNKS